jgi:uncharacterized protein (TIGR02246 family)
VNQIFGHEKKVAANKRQEFEKFKACPTRLLPAAPPLQPITDRFGGPSDRGNLERARDWIDRSLGVIDFKQLRSKNGFLEELMSIEARIKESLDMMTEGWRRGSGKLFAQPFSKEARFVAFDGSIHRGPDEIAAFHQRAFDTVLKGTSLDLDISEIKQIDHGIWLVFSKGWHRPSNAPAKERRAESVNLFVYKADEEKAEVLAFQNTRARPITDQASAESWGAFDSFWKGRESGNA